MDWPLSAGFDEAEMMPRMPVAGREYRNASKNRRIDPAIQHGHHGITMFDWQRAAWTKVDLDIDDDQCVARPQGLIQHLPRIRNLDPRIPDNGPRIPR
jgi:hypothetical protein